MDLFALPRTNKKIIIIFMTHGTGLVATNNPILYVTEELTGAAITNPKVNNCSFLQQSLGQDTKPSTVLFSEICKTFASKKNKIRAIITADKMSLLVPRRKVKSIFNLQLPLAPSDIEDRICHFPNTTKSDMKINRQFGVTDHGALSTCVSETINGIIAPKSCYPDGRLSARQPKLYPRPTSTYFKPIKSDN